LAGVSEEKKKKKTTKIGKHERSPGKVERGAVRVGAKRRKGERGDKKRLETTAQGMGEDFKRRGTSTPNKKWGG